MAPAKLMPATFFDTNVLLYAAMDQVRPQDEAKRPIAIGLLDEGRFAISAQVMAEFYYNATKPSPTQLTEDEALQWLDQLSTQLCVAVDGSLVHEGITLARRYEIRYWDGAIVAAAHQANATTLYSEDLNDSQRYGNVTVVNPFKHLPN
jgi:predicted nucleic acid-binding protein